MRKRNQEIRRVVLYARVSTQEQAEKGLSIEAQLRSLRQYSRDRDLEVAREFEEPGASGRDTRRPVFQQMLRFVLSSSNQVDAILVWQSSRFMRNAEEAFVVKRQLTRNGVRVISTSQETTDDPTGRFMQRTFESIDQYESELNGARTSAAMRENAMRGWFNGSHPPFGFGVEKVMDGGQARGRLTPCSEERDVLAEVFREYAAGAGAKRVADSLNERGMRYRRGRPWSKDLVLKVIDDRAAIGTYLYGKSSKSGEDPVPVAVEPLIAPELFDLAQRARAENDPKRYPGRQSSSQTLLSRIAVCGRCGCSYSLQSSGKQSNDGKRPYRYYNCRSSLRCGKATCPGFAVPVETLDGAVLEHVASKLFTDARCRALIDEVSSHSNVLQRRYEAKRKALKSKLKECDRSIDRWYRAFERNELPEDLGTDRMRELKATKERLQAELGGLAAPPRLRAEDLSQEAIASFRRRLQAAFMSEDRELARRYLRELVERVEVTEDRVQVVARPLSAALLMAAETTNAPSGFTTKSEVLTSVGDWLRRTDSNRRPGG